MSNRLSDLRFCINDWVNAQGVPFLVAIIEKTGTPRPATKPYLVISLLGSGEKSGAVDEQRVTNGVLSLVAHRRATVTLKFVGPDASENLCNMRDTLDLPESQSLFSKRGFGVESAMLVRDVSISLDGEYEEQAAFDLVLNYASLVQSKVGYFSDVGIAGYVDGKTGRVTVTKTTVK